MPQLNGKKYSYTKEGIAKYKKDKERKKRFDKAEKLVGGKRFSDYPKVPKKKKKKYTLSEAKQKLKSMGRRGDTELEHVNKDEQRMLKAMGASRTKNPRTGLTENSWFSSAVKRATNYVKSKAPEGIDAQNVGDKIGGVLKGAEEHGGKMVTELVRAPVKAVYTLAGQPDPYNTSSDSGSGSGTTTMSGSGGESGFGGMKRRKKRKKPGEAEGDSQGQNTQGGKMSKRGLRTPKRTGLNIVKKNSSSTSLGM